MRTRTFVRHSILLLFALLLLFACNAPPPPAPTVAAVASTAVALTPTPVPATDTPVPPTATDTAVPLTATSTITATPIPPTITVVARPFNSISANGVLRLFEKKRDGSLRSALDRMSYRLPPALDGAVKLTLEDWRTTGKVRRLWARDAAQVLHVGRQLRQGAGQPIELAELGQTMASPTVHTPRDLQGSQHHAHARAAVRDALGGAAHVDVDDVRVQFFDA